MLTELLYKTRKSATKFAIRILTVVFLAVFLFSGAVNSIVYGLTLPFINTDKENLVFLGYKVYGNENILNDNYEKYVDERLILLKDNDEFMVVKINGTPEKKIKCGYVLIYDEEVIELNVEIYVAKNIDIGKNSLPLKTVFLYVRSIAESIARCAAVLICALCVYTEYRTGVKKEKFLL